MLYYNMKKIVLADCGKHNTKHIQYLYNHKRRYMQINRF